VVDGRTHPRVVEQGTDRTLYIHRRGSNARNGEYYFSYQPGATVVHYPSTGRIDTEALWRAYDAAKQAAISGTLQERIAAAPLLQLPRYYIDGDSAGRIKGSDIRFIEGAPSSEDVRAIAAGLKHGKYWPSMITRRTHPYSGPAPLAVAEGDYAATWVGDASDTSPFLVDEAMEVIGIDAYVANMARLVAFLAVTPD